MVGLLSSRTSLCYFLSSILILLLACSSSGAPLYHICSSTGKYTPNSTYETNLNLLLPSLSSNGSATGFFNNTRGNLPNQVHGLVLCRGDVKTNGCRRCLEIAKLDVVQLCPYNKGAIVWYDDCLLHYSNLFFFSSIDDTKVYMWNTQEVTELDLFNKRLNAMMDSLVDYTKNSSTLLFATGKVNFTLANPLIYGLTQCSRDLSADHCNQCLQGILSESRSSRSMLWRKKGGRILGASCNFRYELYPFYEGAALVSIPLPANTTTVPGLLPPGSNPTGQGYRLERHPVN